MSKKKLLAAALAAVFVMAGGNGQAWDYYYHPDGTGANPGWYDAQGSGNGSVVIIPSSPAFDPGQHNIVNEVASDTQNIGGREWWIIRDNAVLNIGNDASNSARGSVFTTLGCMMVEPGGKLSLSNGTLSVGGSGVDFWLYAQATLDIASTGTLKLTHRANFRGNIMNNGQIDVADFTESMGIHAGSYTGSGVINNSRAITIALDEITSGSAAALATSIAKGNSNNIGTVTMSGETKDDMVFTGATGGTLTLSNYTANGKKVDAGGADVTLRGGITMSATASVVTTGKLDVQESTAGSKIGTLTADGKINIGKINADGLAFGGKITSNDTGADAILLAVRGATFNEELVAAHGGIQLDTDSADNIFKKDITAQSGFLVRSSGNSFDGDITVTNGFFESGPQTTGATFGGNTFNGDITISDGATALAGYLKSTSDTFNNSAIDLSGATGTSTLDGSTFNQSSMSTGGALNITGGVEAGTASLLYSYKVITITGNDNVLLGGIKSDTSIELTSGSSTIGGDIHTGASGAFTVHDGATYIAAGKDTKVLNGGFVTQGGARILFGKIDNSDDYAKIDLDASTGPSINLASGTILDANPREIDRSKEHVAFTANAVNSLQIDSSTDKDALRTYLDALTKNTLKGKYYFALKDDGTIVHGFLANGSDDDIETQLRKILAAQGVGDIRGMISASGLRGMLEALDVVGSVDLDELAKSNPQAAYALKIMAGLGGQNYWYNLNGNPNAAYAAHQWMQGTDYAGAVDAVSDTVRSFNNAISNRSYNLGGLLNSVEYDECGNIIENCGASRNRIWAGYTGLWGRDDGREWDSGYKYNAHGINVGYDHVTSSGIGFGSAFGYSRGDFENRGSLGDDSKIHNYSFGLFASYNHASGFFSTLSGTYTYSKYKMDSRVIDPGSFVNPADIGSLSDRADFHGDSWSFGGKVGHDWRAARNFTLTPTLGLYYYTTNTNRFNTSLGRNGMKYSSSSVEMPVEVTAKYDIATGCDSTLSVVATAGYAYNFTNKGTKVKDFNIPGLQSTVGDNRLPKPGRSSWNAGGGLQYRYRNMDFGVNYEYYGRKEYKSHNLNASVGISF